MHPTQHLVAPAYPTMGGLPAALPVPPEARPVALDTPKVHHVPAWAGFSDPQRLSFLRKIVDHAGRDPRIATLTVKILREASVEPRQYKSQAAAILKWVQNNIYYVNEPGERLQDPLYTLRVGYGDCDDLAILLASMFESVRMSWKFVLSGVDKRTGEKVRYIEGNGAPSPTAQWSHIYVMVGWPPFRPTKWEYAEPTLKRAPLGWDVVGFGSKGPMIMPEMQLAGSTPVVAGSVAAAETNDNEDGSKEPAIFSRTFFRQVVRAVTIGVSTAVLTSVVLKAFPALRSNTPSTRRNYNRRRIGRALEVVTYR
jgi:hypothetical protein